MDAKKTAYKGADALAIVQQVDQLLVAKGKSVVRVDLKQEKPSDESLKKLLLGPTGNLRAPTLRKGKTLVVGFDAEMYREVFGSSP